MSGLQLRAEIGAWRKRRRLRRRPVAGRALAAIERTGLVFLHIPKTGGKTVIRSLYGLDLHDYFGHAGAGFYETLIGPRALARMRRFAVVRDPVARLRSAYGFGRAGGFDLPLDREIRDRLGDLDWAGFLASDLPADFAARYPTFRPQIGFLRGRGGALGCDVLLRTETLAADLRRLAGEALHDPEVGTVNAGRRAPPAAADPATEAAAADLVARLYPEDAALAAGRLVPFVDAAEATA